MTIDENEERTTRAGKARREKAERRDSGLKSPVKRRAKQPVRFGRVVWTCILQGFLHVGFMGNMA